MLGVGYLLSHFCLDTTDRVDVRILLLLILDACGAFIFSIDEKTKQKNLNKIKAQLEAGTLAHLFCLSTPAKRKIVENLSIHIIRRILCLRDFGVKKFK